MTTERPAIVNYEDRTGHFVMRYTGGPADTPGELIGIDLGGVLQLFSRPGDPWLTPAEARALASALTWWADRPHGDSRAPDAAVDEALGLLGLIEEDA